MAAGNNHLVLAGCCNGFCKEGHYQEDEVRSATAIATKSVDELPRCAQLSHFLPGPSLSAYELSHSGNFVTRDSSFIAPLLQAR